jgi:hypothetical protein
MMAYRPLRVVFRHASNLGPRRPSRIAKENPGNADSSRARSVSIDSDVAHPGCRARKGRGKPNCVASTRPS